ncbi:MAG: hypothetical protein M0R21_08855 [Lentimicrobiaceae bacterium]|nr:hypothetical protein [Lentimicrobiaceae bacterium]
MKSFPDGMGGYAIKENVIKLEEAIQQSCNLNPWFTRENILKALHSIGNSLEESKTEHWLLPYRNKLNLSKDQKTVALVMAGNIPLVGFHDFLCVLVSGHKALIKLSSNDDKLLPVLSQILIDAEPSFAGKIEFAENKLAGFNAVIATGSNNSSRYFEYYFGKYPNIIRKNRNSVAILTGNEMPDKLKKLGNDMLTYFGLGCRSVSFVYVPENYSFQPLSDAIAPFRYCIDHNKFRNNYDYHKSLFIMNNIAHYDTGILLFRPENTLQSAVSVVHYSVYNNLSEVETTIAQRRDDIQCIVGNYPGAIPFGTAQEPELWDYADGVDTLNFLLSL